MPTLQFKGKNIIWNHHLSIPYHTLDEVEKLHFQPDKADGNLIIEGDNLLALKALLPQYTGKIKCIYIDPPYNTGNEGWVYNDNVNSPMLKEWLGKEVGKDDLTRHDKWLCMIVPRIKILRELLSEDGLLFISCDDNEISSLRQTCDEIFTESNFITTLTIKANPRGRQSDNDIATLHDFLLCYSKNSQYIEMGGVPLTTDDIDEFDKEDPDGKKWRELGLRQRGSASLREDRKDMYFPIFVDPEDFSVSLSHSKKHTIEVLPKKSDGRDGRWMWSPKKVSDEIERVYARLIKKRNEYDIFIKDYLDREDGQRTKKPKSLWLDKDVNTESGGKLLRSLLPNCTFPYPKPIGLIKRIVQIASNSHTIVLDSFAGSGTTMHAVMDLNKEDGGNRKCILIQMTEATDAEPKKNICKDITRERVKRAIEKYDYDSGFQYLKVGIPIDAETLLSGNLPTYKQFAEYVYYLCTGESLKDKKSINEKSFFVGDTGNSIIYLVYKQNFDELTRMALNLTLAEKITAEHPKKRIVVYAPACFLEEDYMTEKGIDYVGIPYNLFQRSEV